MKRRDGDRPAILFVNQHYPPDVASTGQHLADLAEHLANNGFHVTVWCGRGSYSADRLKVPPAEYRNGVEVRRLPTTHANRDRHLTRLLSYGLFYARVFAQPRRSLYLSENDGMFGSAGS